MLLGWHLSYAKVNIKLGDSLSRIYELNTFLSHLRGVEFDEEMHQLIESKRNIERYIYNMGGDPDELASQIGVNRDTLLNENNWSDSTFSFNDNKFSNIFSNCLN